VSRIEYPVIAEFVFNNLKPEMFFEKENIRINLNSQGMVAELCEVLNIKDPFTEVSKKCFGKMTNYINGMKLLVGGDFVSAIPIRENIGIVEYLDKNPTAVFLREPVYRRQHLKFRNPNKE